jgi:hypothetical protein
MWTEFYYTPLNSAKVRYGDLHYLTHIYVTVLQYKEILQDIQENKWIHLIFTNEGCPCLSVLSFTFSMLNPISPTGICDFHDGETSSQLEPSVAT